MTVWCPTHGYIGNARFCPNCGLPLQEVPTCKGCGMELHLKGDLFCRHCGAKLP